MKIYILAQGQGSRWRYDSHRVREIDLPSEYKQLLPIGKGEVLIQRTIRQIGESIDELDVTLIAPGDFLLYPYPEWMKFQSFREPTGCILEGICRTKNEWAGERVLFLLGDVIYSNRMMKEIINNRDTVSFFGRKGKNVFTDKEASEIFAFGFNDTQIMQDVLWQEMRHLWFRREIDAKLWTLLSYLKLSIVEVENDYTDDVDSPEEYEQFYEKLKELALEDDERQYT